MLNSSDERPSSRDAFPRLTNALVGAAVGFAVVDWVFDPVFFAPQGLVIPGYLYALEAGFAPLLASPFLHAGAGFSELGGLHLIANLILLLLVGPVAERLLGRPRFLLVYLLSAWVGMLASATLRPELAFFAGSAGPFGLLGMLLGFAVLRKGVVPTLFASRALPFLAVSVTAVLMISVHEPYLNNLVHLGAFVTGFLLATVVEPKLPSPPTPVPGIVSAVAIAAAMAMFCRGLEQTPIGTLAESISTADEYRAADDRLRTIALLEQGLTDEPTASANRVLRTTAQNYLAWMYVETGRNLDRGIELAEEASREMADRPEFLDTLGYLYALKGQCKEAADAMGRAAAIDAAYEARRVEIERACAAGERPDTEIPVEKPPEQPQPTPDRIQARFDAAATDPTVGIAVRTRSADGA